MAVFRVEKNSGYTVMSNHHLRNRALSLKAKGLLYALSGRIGGQSKSRRTNLSDGPCRRSQGRRKGTKSQEVPHGQAEKAIHPGTAGCRKKGAEQANTATGKDKGIGGIHQEQDTDGKESGGLQLHGRGTGIDTHEPKYELICSIRFEESTVYGAKHRTY